MFPGASHLHNYPVCVYIDWVSLCPLSRRSSCSDGIPAYLKFLDRTFLAPVTPEFLYFWNLCSREFQQSSCCWVHVYPPAWHRERTQFGVWMQLKATFKWQFYLWLTFYYVYALTMLKRVDLRFLKALKSNIFRVLLNARLDIKTQHSFYCQSCHYLVCLYWNVIFWAITF